MSKHNQRKTSAYDVGRKIGQRIYRHDKPADRTEFNQAFRRMYTGRTAFYPVAFAAACHAFQNCKVLAQPYHSTDELIRNPHAKL